jgi:hypothetical protein
VVYSRRHTHLIPGRGPHYVGLVAQWCGGIRRDKDGKEAAGEAPVTGTGQVDMAQIAAREKGAAAPSLGQVQMEERIVVAIEEGGVSATIMQSLLTVRAIHAPRPHRQVRPPQSTICSLAHKLSRGGVGSMTPHLRLRSFENRLRLRGVRAQSEARSTRIHFDTMKTGCATPCIGARLAATEA